MNTLSHRDLNPISENNEGDKLTGLGHIYLWVGYLSLLIEFFLVALLNCHDLILLMNLIKIPFTK